VKDKKKLGEVIHLCDGCNMKTRMERYKSAV